VLAKLSPFFGAQSAEIKNAFRPILMAYPNAQILLNMREIRLRIARQLV